jgi:hypothetical protein
VATAERMRGAELATSTDGSLILKKENVESIRDKF